MKHLATVLTLLLWTCAAAGELEDCFNNSYHISINASHSTINDEGDRPYSVFGQDSSLRENWTLDVKYHLRPVMPPVAAPLAEAAFLDRSDFVYGQATRRQIGRVSIAGDRPLPINGSPTGAPGWGDRQQTVKVNSLAAGGQYFVPGSNIYLAGGIEHARTLYGETGIAEDRRDRNWTVAAGYLPIEGLLLAAVVGEDAETNFRGLAAKYVWETPGEHHINLEANSYHSRYFDRAGALLDFYFSPTLSIGGGYARAHFSGQGSEDEYTLRSRKFFGPLLNVGVSYSKSRYANNLMLEAGYRF